MIGTRMDHSELDVFDFVPKICGDDPGSFAFPEAESWPWPEKSTCKRTFSKLEEVDIDDSSKHDNTAKGKVCTDVPNNDEFDLENVVHDILCLPSTANILDLNSPGSAHGDVINVDTAVEVIPPNVKVGNSLSSLQSVLSPSRSKIMPRRVSALTREGGIFQTHSSVQNVAPRYKLSNGDNDDEMPPSSPFRAMRVTEVKLKSSNDNTSDKNSPDVTQNIPTCASEPSEVGTQNRKLESLEPELPRKGREEIATSERSSTSDLLPLPLPPDMNREIILALQEDRRKKRVREENEARARLLKIFARNPDSHMHKVQRPRAGDLVHRNAQQIVQPNVTAVNTGKHVEKNRTSNSVVESDLFVKAGKSRGYDRARPNDPTRIEQDVDPRVSSATTHSVSQNCGRGMTRTSPDTTLTAVSIGSRCESSLDAAAARQYSNLQFTEKHTPLAAALEALRRPQTAHTAAPPLRPVVQVDSMVHKRRAKGELIESPRPALAAALAALRAPRISSAVVPQTSPIKATASSEIVAYAEHAEQREALFSRIDQANFFALPPGSSIGASPRSKLG